MRMRIDFSDITEEKAFARALPPRVRRQAWLRVRQVSFNVERRVKLTMPVDTGRARASWGHSTPPASPADGVWIEREADLSIEQGSNVEYIENLNNGSSLQAPAGFIDAAARAGADELSNLLSDDLARMS